VSSALILRDARKMQLPSEDIFDCLLAILIGGLIGGRLLFVMTNLQYYLRNPLRIFMFYEGGLAFQGALVMAVIFAVFVVRKKKLVFWEMSDLIAPYIALGQAIGRIGCFFNGCCYGRIVDGPFGVVFPGEMCKRFPMQLLMSLLLFLLFIFLLEKRKRKVFNGQIFCGYLILYGILRFFLDFFRGDELFMFGWIRLSQVIGAGIFGAGVIVYIFLLKNMNTMKD